MSMASVKGLMGVVGCGKSVACCHEVNYRAEMMPADPVDGVRRSRWIVVRNTYQELVRTTIKTWLEWYPDTEMHWSSPITGRLRRPSMRKGADGNPDGTEVEIEVVFYGLDRAEQARGLKGIECSGAWINEACEIKEEWLSLLIGRIGRYPRKRPEEGFEPMSLGVIMDTNPPSDTSWYYELAEVKKPAGYEFFRYPPAVLRREDKATGRIWYEPNDGRDPGVPAAENVENLAEGFKYYMKQTLNGDHDYIKVYLMGEYGTTVRGAAVYPEYSDSVNFLDGDPEPHWGLPIFLGTDFGRTPCSVILQVLRDGQIVVYDEVCTEKCSIREYCTDFLRPLLVKRYRFAEGARIMNFGDPAGNNPTETDAQGCIALMNECGIPTVPCPVKGNSFRLRRDAVAEALRARLDGGRAGLVVTKRCKRLRNGFLGRYYYRTMNTADMGDERYGDSPEKNMFSHPHDALQYAVFGATHQSGESMFDLVSGRQRGVSRAEFDAAAARAGIAGYGAAAAAVAAGGQGAAGPTLDLAGFV